MRTVAIRINLYKADELNPKAFERAYREWLENYEYPYEEDNENSLKAFLEMFGDSVKVRIGMDGNMHPYLRTLTLCIDPQLKELKGERAAKWFINNTWEYMNRPKTYRLRSGKSRQSRIFTEEGLPTGYVMDEYLLSPIREAIEMKHPERTVKQTIRKCIEAWCESYATDYDYCTSEECFKEEAKENGWEYDAEGELKIDDGTWTECTK